MILVIGGASSGKRTYVKSLGYAESDMSADAADACPVLTDLQDVVSRDPAAIEELLPLLQRKEVVVCNEVGSGVIPVEHGERIAREQTGRLCIQLAQRAQRVVRLVCGLPSVIKG